MSILLIDVAQQWSMGNEHSLIYVFYEVSSSLIITFLRNIHLFKYEFVAVGQFISIFRNNDVYEFVRRV